MTDEAINNARLAALIADNEAMQRRVRRIERVVLVCALLFVLLLVWVLLAEGSNPVSAALGVVVFFTPTLVIGLLLLTAAGILWGRWKASRAKRRTPAAAKA